MADMTGLDLPERVERIEHKVDVLSTRVDALSQSVDKRFDEVSEHFVEQREYTEFGFERLRKEMVAGFTRLEVVIATNTRGFGRLERKLDQFIAAYEPPPRGRRARRTPKKPS